MKKRILSITLALLMVLALLPFGALAADDLSPYEPVLKACSPKANGTYYELNGDKVPELILVWDDNGKFAVEIYTITDGKAKRIFDRGIDTGTVDFRFARVLENSAGQTQIILNDQYSEYVYTDEDGDDWYSSHLRNEIYAVNGSSLTLYATTDRLEFRTLPDEDGNYWYSPDESVYKLDGAKVSDETYYDWMDRYYEEFEYVLDLCPDEIWDGMPVKQLLAFTQTGFYDVPGDMWYADAVVWAAANRITNGTGNFQFSPDNPCTRGQVVTFLWRAAGEPAAKISANPFKDVKEGAYYYDAVLWAVEQGITKGTSADKFSPDEPCTRGQVVTFLHRYEKTPKVEANNPFKDVQADAYYYDAVLWAVKNEITNGTSATTFSPDQTCTRGQIVTFLYRDLAE